ncbi:MAG: acetolactate synthase large subunit [Patescibacteria group bacterium]
MRAAELFVESLEASGVEYIFGVPGEENLAFLEAIRSSTIRLITTRDEQAAVFMAATVGRLTGRVGVALSTLGPGATNLVTGVAYAQLGGMPLLVITGQKPIKKSKQGKFQIIDVVGMMKPITKMSETIVSGDRIATTVYQAVRTAEDERPGAVHIELPEDIAEEETDALPIPWHEVRRPDADQSTVESAVLAIKNAKMPVVVIAAGANRKWVRGELHKFLELTGIPFITSQMGKGVEDESSRLYLGTTALTSHDFMHHAILSADLIIMIGHDITEKPPVLAKNSQKIIHINFYPADMDDVYRPDIEVIGDIAQALRAISEQLDDLPKWDFRHYFAIKKNMIEDINSNVDDPRFPIHPKRFVYELRESLPRDAFLSLDNGMYKIWVARNYPAYEQNSVLLDNALATMGAGLPVGIATKLLNPQNKVVVVAGDGGFMMNLADLETAVRLKLDMVVIILNDNGYGMIKWKQEGMNLPKFGLDFGNPDFVKLADSFGAKGHKVESAKEFKPLIEKCINQKGVHLIDLSIDYSMNNEEFGSGLKARVESKL